MVKTFPFNINSYCFIDDNSSKGDNTVKKRDGILVIMTWFVCEWFSLTIYSKYPFGSFHYGMAVDHWIPFSITAEGHLLRQNILWSCLVVTFFHGSCLVSSQMNSNRTGTFTPVFLGNYMGYFSGQPLSDHRTLIVFVENTELDVRANRVVHKKKLALEKKPTWIDWGDDLNNFHSNMELGEWMICNNGHIPFLRPIRKKKYYWWIYFWQLKVRITTKVSLGRGRKTWWILLYK